MARGKDAEEVIQHLRSLSERVVLSYAYRAAEGELEFVCETDPRRDLGAHRAFARFVFRGVEDYRRERGRWPVVGHAFLNRYNLRQAPGAPSVDEVEVSWSGSDGEIWISLGSAFGAIRWRFSDVLETVIQLRAVEKEGPTWEYFEVGTGEKVDFYRPFEPSQDVRSPRK